MNTKAGNGLNASFHIINSSGFPVFEGSLHAIWIQSSKPILNLYFLWAWYNIQYNRSNRSSIILKIYVCVCGTCSTTWAMQKCWRRRWGHLVCTLIENKEQSWHFHPQFVTKSHLAAPFIERTRATTHSTSLPETQVGAAVLWRCTTRGRQTTKFVLYRKPPLFLLKLPKAKTKEMQQLMEAGC